MNLQFLYFTMQGRTSRQSFWLALAGLLLASWAASFVVQWMAGMMAGNEVMGRLASGMVMVISLVALVGLISICVKRFHDRDRSGWWMAPLYIVSILSALAVSSGLAITADGPTSMGLAQQAVWLGVVLWLLVELGGLKGTAGPNRYGPDPLQSRSAQATS
jgi:uncharacterized membrane protein YhaH (DUF805 family)